MAVFKYVASRKDREDHEDSGTVLGRDERDAREKLHRLEYDQIRLMRLGGFTAIVRSLRADVK